MLESGAHGRIRTDTENILSVLTLPIGLHEQNGARGGS